MHADPLASVLFPHAKRLGVDLARLAVALMQHGAQELAAWTEERETADPGSVWQTGDVPDWLEAHLPQPPDPQTPPSAAAINNPATR